MFNDFFNYDMLLNIELPKKELTANNDSKILI